MHGGPMARALIPPGLQGGDIIATGLPSLKATLGGGYVYYRCDVVTGSEALFSGRQI